MKLTLGLALATTIGLASGAFTTSAHAEWPERPITMIVPWSAGGGTDAIARILAAELETALGKPVNVVNRTGGSGAVGHSQIVASPADGYTIGLATAEFISYYWTGVAEFTQDDVTPIGLVNFDAGAFSVAEGSPWTDLAAALAAIKAEPAGTYKVSAPIGGSYHIALGGLLQKEGIDPKTLTVVPTQGAAPGMQELASGGVDIAPFSLPEARAMLESGHARALAVYAEERLEAFPDVPTATEATGDAYVGGTWRGIVAPAGLDEAVEKKLEAALQTAVSSDAYKSFMADRGFGWGWIPGDEFAAFLAEQHDTTGDVLDKLGLKQRD